MSRKLSPQHLYAQVLILDLHIVIPQFSTSVLQGSVFTVQLLQRKVVSETRIASSISHQNINGLRQHLQEPNIFTRSPHVKHGKFQKLRFSPTPLKVPLHIPLGFPIHANGQEKEAGLANRNILAQRVDEGYDDEISYSYV